MGIEHVWSKVVFGCGKHARARRVFLGRAGAGCFFFRPQGRLRAAGGRPSACVLRFVFRVLLL